MIFDVEQEATPWAGRDWNACGDISIQAVDSSALAQFGDHEFEHVLKFTSVSPENVCATQPWSIRLDKILPDSFQLLEHAAAVRLPEITLSSLPDSKADRCIDGSPIRVYADTYDVKAENSVGGTLVNDPLSFTRTEANFYGNTEDKPVSWMLDSAPAQFGTGCGFRGFSTDLVPPGKNALTVGYPILIGLYAPSAFTLLLAIPQELRYFRSARCR